MNIESRLNNLPDFAAPVVEVARSLLSLGGIEAGEGYYKLGNDKSVAPLYYLMTIWDGRNEDELKSRLARFDFKVPSMYRAIYVNFAGLSIHDLDIFGTLVYPGVQPLDVVAANQFWRNPYKSVRELFHFGGRRYTTSENAGYFMRDDVIEVQTEEGTILEKYNCLSDFFDNEIAIVAAAKA